MSRLSSLFLVLLFLASAPPADAQLRGLLNLARDAVSGASDTARGAVDAPPRPAEGVPAPAVDFVSLLDTRFYPQRGTFASSDPFLLFPPSGLVGSDDVRGQFLIRDTSGRVVVRTTIGQVERTGAAAIARLRARAGVPTDVNQPVEPGKSYTFDVELFGDVVGTLPFTVGQSSNGDPYDPVTTLALEGPWRTHAYFEHEAEKPEYRMHFHAWIAPDEMTSREMGEVSIRRDGREVAWGSKNAQLAHGWGHTDFLLLTPESRRDQFGRASATTRLWTIQDVTPGEYEIVLSTEAGPFRTFTIQGGDGAFVPHPRSAVDYTPRKHFLGTRRMSDQNLSTPHQLYWIAPDSM